MKPAYLLIALAAPLAGCVSLLPKAPPAPLVYSIAAAPPQATGETSPKPIVIAVQAPNAPRTIASADIVWVTNGRLAFIDGAVWDGRAPELLQTLLVHTIDRAGAARGAVRAGEGRADSEISWDLTSFGVTEDGALQAHFAAHVNLIAMRGHALIASLEVDESAPLKDRSSSAAAAALQEAARHGADKIAAWAAAQTPEPAPDPASKIP